MSHLIQALAAGALALCCGGVPLAFPALDREDPRDLAPHVKISLREAVSRAVAARPGRAFEAELELWTEGEQHGLAYEVDLVGPHGELFEVSIDAQTGAARSIEQDEDEEEVRAARTVLRHCELDLSALIAKAEEIAKGSAVSAELEYADGPLCQLRFANSRYLIEVELEGRAGHLLGIGLVPEEGHEGEEEEEEVEEEDCDDEEDGADEEEGGDHDGDDDESEKHGREGSGGGEIHVRHVAPLDRMIAVLVGIF